MTDPADGRAEPADAVEEGTEDLDARVVAEARRAYADRLAAAKVDAARRGKEPFDLEKLEAMCDTTRQGKVDPVERRHARFENMYYTYYPEVMTLAAFAEKVEELNRW